MNEDTKSNIIGTIVGLVVIALIVGLMSFLCAAAQYTDETEVRAYHAWVKQTGNPKEITCEEWRDLLHAHYWQNQRELEQ